MMEYVRDISVAMGSPEKKVMDTEVAIAEKLRQYNMIRLIFPLSTTSSDLPLHPATFDQCESRFEYNFLTLIRIRDTRPSRACPLTMLKGANLPLACPLLSSNVFLIEIYAQLA